VRTVAGAKPVTSSSVHWQLGHRFGTVMRVGLPNASASPFARWHRGQSLLLYGSSLQLMQRIRNTPSMNFSPSCVHRPSSFASATITETWRSM